MDLDALEYVPSPIVVLDRAADGKFVYVWMNRAAAEFSGFDLEDLFGKSSAEAFPGRAGERLAARQSAAGRDGKRRAYTYTLETAKGPLRIETKLEPVLDRDGTVVRLIANMTDRTLEHELTERQVVADSDMHALQAEAEQFIALAAHDLRSPMRQVRQIAELLREDFIDNGDGKLELINMLEEIGGKASAMISDVLAFSRASQASRAETRTCVDLAVLSSDIFTVLDPHRQHQLHGGAGLIETDGVALQIVLRNLVDNSLKHGGCEHLELRIACEGEEAGLLAFSVRDSGRGFDDPGIAFLDRQEFRYETGFGLLGIKRLIKSRGGDIWAEAPPHGPGSLIWFTLPGRILNSGTEDPVGLRAAAGPVAF